MKIKRQVSRTLAFFFNDPPLANLSRKTETVARSIDLKSVSVKAPEKGLVIGL